MTDIWTLDTGFADANPTGVNKVTIRTVADGDKPSKMIISLKDRAVAEQMVRDHNAALNAPALATDIRKHTPAPWTITQTEFAGGPAIMVDPVAIVLGHGQVPNANARLIAAAPKLRSLIVTLANMTTPMDGLVVRDSMHIDMVMAERTDDQLCGDADALYSVIEEARSLLEAI